MNQDLETDLLIASTRAVQEMDAAGVRPTLILSLVDGKTLWAFMSQEFVTSDPRMVMDMILSAMEGFRKAQGNPTAMNTRFYPIHITGHLGGPGVA